MTEIQTPTPRDAFELLLVGNQRFVAGAPDHPNQDATRRAEIAPAQRLPPGRRSARSGCPGRPAVHPCRPHPARPPRRRRHTGTQAHTIVATAKEGGLGAVAGMNLGSTANQVYGVLGDSLLDGLRLCLVVAAILALVAAACAVVLLRRPKQQGTAGAQQTDGAARHGHPDPSAENAQAASTAQPLGHRRG